LVRRLLDEDPLDEEAVRTFLTTMGRLGQPVAARGLYNEFLGHLERELGLEPTAEPVAAFEALRDIESGAPGGHQVDAAASTGVRSASGLLGSRVDEASGKQLDADLLDGGQGRKRRFANLPKPATRFVGRDVELREIAERLRSPDCRLLSVVGQGGVGKTRLALAVAERLQADDASGFEDGVLFVPLDVTRSSAEVVPVLADALGIRPVPGEDPLSRIAAALKDARVLLVLDNFEHVLDAAEVVTRLLAASSGVKVLITTRERLSLDAEWVYPVEGLDYPDSTTPLETQGDYGAVRLLV